MEKVSLFFKKEFWGTLCFAIGLILTTYSIGMYSYNQKIDLSQSAILIAPLFVTGLSLFSVRATEGYFQNKLTAPDVNTPPEVEPDIKPTK